MARSVTSVAGRPSSRRGFSGVLPPFHRRPGAFAAAAAAGLAGALGASREELGHELRHIGQLRVGVQHVHGLFHFLRGEEGNGETHTHTHRCEASSD